MSSGEVAAEPLPPQGKKSSPGSGFLDLSLESFQVVLDFRKGLALRLVVLRFLGMQVRPFQEFPRLLLHQLEPVRVPLKVAEHDVLFQVQEVVLAVFGKQERILENGVRLRSFAPEQRVAGFADDILTHFLDPGEQFLTGPAQNDFLVLLKISEKFLEMIPPWSLERARPAYELQLFAGLDDDGRILALHLSGQVFEYGGVGQQLQLGIVLGMGATQSIDEQLL